ncbi:hypothetical protein E8E11_001748 [Didymella keratinophila]|nr:hypothetical protein E8E11_001748 [Didymella keratinophila]
MAKRTSLAEKRLVESMRYLLGDLVGLERPGLVFPEDLDPELVTVLFVRPFPGISIADQLWKRFPLLEDPVGIIKEETWTAILKDEKLLGMNCEWVDPTVMGISHVPKTYPEADKSSHS